jgi:hypothetical protein
MALDGNKVGERYPHIAQRTVWLWPIWTRADGLDREVWRVHALRSRMALSLMSSCRNHGNEAIATAINP